MELVVGHRVEGLGVGPAAVIPVDHLAHQPELGFQPVGEPAQVLHKAKVQHICGVQPDAVDVKLFHPEFHRVKVILLHLRVPLVQLDQQVVAAPVAIGEAVVVFVVAPEVHIAEPVLVAAALAMGFQVLKGEKAAAHMVEHAVHNHLLAPLVALGHKVGEFLVGAQPAVHQTVVDGVVAVGAALKQRADINSRAAQLIGVGRPGVQLFKGAGHSLPVVFVGAPAQAQRVNVIEYSAVVPSHNFIHSCNYCFSCCLISHPRLSSDSITQNQESCTTFFQIW